VEYLAIINGIQRDSANIDSYEGLIEFIKWQEVISKC